MNQRQNFCKEVVRLNEGKESLEGEIEFSLLDFK